MGLVTSELSKQPTQQRQLVEVVTPTYGPDIELCADLNRSVRRHGTDVLHRIIVPRSDLSATSGWADDTTVVVPADTYLPAWLRRVPGNVHVDIRRPWWPVRGWITQQIIKLEATSRSSASVVVVADSDLFFVRAFDRDSFCVDGRPSWFRLADGVHREMPRHLAWHAVARELLGLPVSTANSLPDYICWPCSWEPAVVRAMLQRIEDVHSRPWQRLIAAQRHFSEMILYGVYVEEVCSDTRARVPVDQMRCVHHSAEDDLDGDGIRALLATLSPDDVAVMISARSGTELAVRRRALAAFGGEPGDSSDIDGSTR